VAKGLETQGNPGPQPPAANMRQLSWDPELAEMAQASANQCVYQHDANRNVPRFVVGQNIALQYSTAQIPTSSWSSIIGSWYSEVSNMQLQYVNSFNSPTNTSVVIGHYTQLVWANTQYIGCGLMNYQDNIYKPTFPYKIFYVCNYGPTGNYLGQPIYTIGTAGSQCPAGTTNNNGLCA